MTCIIGMYYNSGSGALLIADSRTMMGGDYSRDRKLYEVVAKQVVFAGSGLSGISRKLVDSVRTAQQRPGATPDNVVTLFEDEMAELHNRYKMTRPFRFSADDPLLNGIIGVMTTDGPRLHCLYENGYSDDINDFRAVGHGARHAHNIMRSLYDSTLSEQAALEIGIHALVEVSKVDAMVDDWPQIAKLETGKDIGILNLDAKAKFRFECERTEKVKGDLGRMEAKRVTVFHLLLDGSGIKGKLDNLLKEYQDEKPEPPGDGTANP